MVVQFLALIQNNYLLFHVLVEGFSITVALLSYVLSTRTYKYSGNSYLLFLGVGLLYVAGFDFFHLMTYKGMNLVPGISGANLATQFWLAGRYLLTAILLFAPLFAKRKMNTQMLHLIWITASLPLLLSITCLKNFPAAFVDGRGLTSFKIYSEYTLIVLLIIAAILLWRKKDLLGKTLFRTMMGVMFLSILSELCFTLYADPYGVSNLLGHIFKLSAYYLIFSGIVQRGLDMPLESFFDELRDVSIKDPLTGLYNRLGSTEFLKKAIAQAGREQQSIGIMIMDLDNFKTVNDLHGHAAGDEVLKEFARLLRSEVRESDIICRQGGDEFLIIAKGGFKDMEFIEERLKAAFRQWTRTNRFAQPLGLSVGIAVQNALDIDDPDHLLAKADERMYQQKAKHKEKDYSASASFVHPAGNNPILFPTE